MTQNDPIPASAALAAYAESLIEGRRVIVFGDSSSRLAECLLERGARLVHVYDPDPGRVAESTTRNPSRNVTYAPLGEGGVAVREGAFDLAIVDNLAALGEPAPVLERLKKTLSARAAALIVSPNPARSDDPSLEYYALYDCVASHFDEVKMLGQTPFRGYAVVDFAEQGEPEITVDAAYVPGGAEEPEWFVAVGGPEGLKLDPFLVVQLPETTESPQKAAFAQQRIAHLEASLQTAHDELSELRDQSQASRDTASRVADLEAQAEKAEKLLKAARSDQERQKRQAEEAAHSADKALAELSTAREEIKALKQQLGNADRKDDSKAKAQISDAQRARDDALDDRDRALDELDQAERELKQLRTDLDRARRDLKKASTELSQARTDTNNSKRKQAPGSDARPPTATSEDAQADIERLEALLRDRAHTIRQLERDLKTAEDLGRRLGDEFGQAATTPGAAPPDLAQKNAELEAEIATLKWTVQQLEGRLNESRPRSG